MGMNAQYNTCPYNSLVLRTQAEVDNFINNYPSCDRISSTLEIKGTDISSLSGLKNLRFINTLKISQTSLTTLTDLEAIEGIGILEITGNSNLLNLDGLQKIQKLGLDGNFNAGLVIQDNSSLQNLEGLNNLKEIRSFELINNSSLNSIEELKNLSGEMGRIEISKNPQLKNLQGLENIESINVALLLEENGVTNLEGLTNLKVVDFISIIKEDALVDLSGVSNLEMINRNLIIQYCPTLTDLTGLEKLTVSDSLEIHLKYNIGLKNLNGLQNLKQIKEFRFWGQESLENFNGLESLETVHGRLEVWKNQGLIDFSGLASIMDLGELSVRENNDLVNFEGINSLEKVSGIAIHSNEKLLNIKGLENLSETQYFTIQDNQSLKELCNFNNLTELLRLQIGSNNNLKSFQGLETLNKVENISLGGASISSLNGLNNLSWVGSMYLVGLTMIENLQGLENLVTIEENLFIARNPILKTIASLQNAKPIYGELTIEKNSVLENLDGLENITRLKNLILESNPTLRSIQALENLESVEGEVKIYDNEKLQFLTGLESLRMANSIRIQKNRFLRDINSLRNVNFEELAKDMVISPFWVTDNPYLTECSIANVCNYLSRPEFAASFNNNKRGCSSNSEVLEKCEQTLNSINGVVRYNESPEGNCEDQNYLVNNIAIQTISGEQYYKTFSNYSGKFEFYLENGVYDFSAELTDEYRDYFEITPQILQVDLNSSTEPDSLKFCLLKKRKVNDLEINILPIEQASPGFNALYNVIIQNNGTETLSGDFNLEFEQEKIRYLGTVSEGGLINTSFESLKPFESREFIFEFEVLPPPTVNIDDELTFKGIISPVSADETPDDNQFLFKQTVTGSYDPNDILVLEGEKITLDESRDYLNYIIRFQNTGTASAIDVKIKHDLDKNLDWGTFTPISSSHSNRIIVKDERYIEFDFENINLPDSTSNEKESHGYVAFRIKPKPAISIGEIIKAKASIFFDFNLPVITNEVSTIVVEEALQDLSIEILENSEISCNGAADAEIEFKVVGGVSPYQYQLEDSSENLVISESNIFSDLKAGSYSIKVIDNASQELSKTFEILEPDPLVAVLDPVDTTCPDLDNGQIIITATGGTAPYEYKLNDQSFTENDVFSGLAVGEYEIWVKDASNCTFTQSVSISENLGSDKDGDGIGDDCDDDIDGDGVLNVDDACNDTGIGESVNSDGCAIFTLPTSNFTITSISETCRTSNNGKIVIAAEAEHEYTASLSGNDFNQLNRFTSETAFSDLETGSYQLCIAIEEQLEFEQCFTIEIDEPEPLEVNSSVNVANRSVFLELKGSQEYVIKVNGLVYRTTEDEIELNLNEERNTISVSTALDCQGIFNEQILLGSELVVYPNPVINGELTIKLPNSNSSDRIEVILFSDNGRQVLSKQVSSQGGNLKMGMDGIVSGVYTLRINIEERSYFSRIIKR